MYWLKGLYVGEIYKRKEEINMLTIFTDTDTDIQPKEAEYYGYKLISMP